MKNKWIIKAVILGFSFFIAAYLVKPIGVSTQFNVAVGMVENVVNKDLIKVSNENGEKVYASSNAYYNKSNGKLAKSIKNPINYGFVFVLAIPVGAYIGYLLLEKNRKGKDVKTNDVSIKKESFSIMSYLPSFIGGFLLLFGARMAGGCTSGHMMSGMMQSSISGFVFACAVFLTAIPIAIFKRKKGN